MYFGPNDPSRNVDITGDINFGRGIYRNDNANVGKLKFQQFQTFLRKMLNMFKMCTNIGRVDQTSINSGPSKPSGAPRHLAGAFLFFSKKNGMFPSRPSGCSIALPGAKISRKTNFF